MVPMSPHRRSAPSDWLIPSALAFLVGAVLFAVLIVVISGGASGHADTLAPRQAAGATGVPTSSGPAAPTTAPPTTQAPPPTTAPAATGATVRTTTGLCLDISPADATEGAQLVQAACDGSAHQRWQAHDLGGGVVNLVNSATGQCVDVANADGSDGARVQQWTCNGGANQQWRTQDAGNDTLLLIAVFSGKCLDVTGGARAEPGVPVQQYTCNGTDAQRWLLS